MKWIVGVSEQNGRLNEFKVLGWSLDRKDIMFQFSRETVVNTIKKGSKYRTAYLGEDGEYIEGSEVLLVEEFGLRTKSNDVVEDNLSELPKF